MQARFTRWIPPDTRPYCTPSRLAPTDTGGNYSVLHNFAGGPADGRLPTAGVVVDSAGSLYGTTFYGGLEDNGVVYRLVRH
jgi:hypothetical protein